MDQLLKPLVLVLVGFTAVPFLLTELLFCFRQFDSDNRHFRMTVWVGTVLNLLGNGAVAYGIAALAFHTRRPLPKILNILRLSCSYQDVALLAKIQLVCMACGILGGMILWVLLLRKNGLRIPGKRKAIVLLIAVMVAGVSLTGIGIARLAIKKLYISEVCRKTEQTFLPDGETYSIAEDDGSLCYAVITNPGKLTCMLKEIRLSDTEDEVPACSFQTAVVPAEGSLCLVMDYDHGLDLDKDGYSSVLLADETGETIDSIRVPRLKDYESFVRTDPEQKDGKILYQGTLLNPDIPVPLFSHESGFYQEAFDLSIQAENGLRVFYTLNCSMPSKASNEYNSPIHVFDRSAEPNQVRSIQNVQNDYLNQDAIGQEPVDKAFVVRAVAMDEEGHFSKVVTKVYFVNLEQYKNDTIVSLVADPEDLFDPDRGIYVTGTAYDAWYEEHLEEALMLPRKKASDNLDSQGKALPSIWDDEPTANYQRNGMAWERPADLIMLKEGDLSLSQNVGIRIQGHASRRGALKRFSIYARKRYSGSRFFDIPIFDDDASHALVLRGGVTNALAQLLAQGRKVLAMPLQPVTVFLNGEYLNRVFLYEKATERLIASSFHVSEPNIAIVKNGVVREDAEEGDIPFQAIYDWLSNHDLASRADYEGFDRIIDVQSFIDATCFQTYMANMDYKERWNNYFWHTIVQEDDAFGDGRWRWGLYDMDLKWWGLLSPLSVEHSYEINPFTMHSRWQKNDKAITNWPIYSVLRKNEDFCRRFVNTMMDLVNTVFKADHVLSLLEYLENTDAETTEFFLHRKEAFLPFMEKEFQLCGTREQVTLKTGNTGAGTIRINTIEPVLATGTWTGEYYTDYPVTVTALSRGGSVFSHWIVNRCKQTGETLEVDVPQGGVTIEAVFSEGKALDQ